MLKNDVIIYTTHRIKEMSSKMFKQWEHVAEPILNMDFKEISPNAI